MLTINTIMSALPASMFRSGYDMRARVCVCMYVCVWWNWEHCVFFNMYFHMHACVDVRLGKRRDIFSAPDFKCHFFSQHHLEEKS